MLRGGVTLTPARSAQIVAQVAAALGYAHRSGVVHRDVKPGNILITRDGQVKVTDFGIAQAVSSEDHLAEAGSVMGTATYFSPEQAEGAAVDGRSDVYSLGVVLYEMLVGRPPFIGDTPVEVSSQHVRSTVPPLSQFSSSVPHDLEAIVMEALSKSPSNRYQSADELRADLIRFSEGQPVHAAMRDTAFFGEDATRSRGGGRGRAHPFGADHDRARAPTFVVDVRQLQRRSCWSSYSAHRSGRRYLLRAQQDHHGRDAQPRRTATQGGEENVEERRHQCGSGKRRTVQETLRHHYLNQSDRRGP